MTASGMHVDDVAAMGDPPVPVITIDGPSGAGKGTIAQRVAESLGFHLLDSGAIYRAAALHVLRTGTALDAEPDVLTALGSFAARYVPLVTASGARVAPHITGVAVFFGDEDVSRELRSEESAAAASTMAVMPGVRQFLLAEQRQFRRAPGLVADGRDMGTVVFPDAQLKVFLTASAETRADRRAKQLKEKGLESNIARLKKEIEIRDQRDSTREHAPLLAAGDALTIDSSELSIRKSWEPSNSELGRNSPLGLQFAWAVVLQD